jgi:hypothetical protein
MTEIEHYMDPEDKTRDVKFILLDRHVQEAGENTTKEMTVIAVKFLVTSLLGFTYSHSRLTLSAFGLGSTWLMR